MAEDFDHALSKNDSYLDSYWISLDDIIEEFEKDREEQDMLDLKMTAQAIAEILQDKGDDDITDSSGYYIIKELGDENIAVDVHKAKEGETEHYVIYCSYSETEEISDFKYTKTLSVDELFEKLKETYFGEKE